MNKNKFLLEIVVLLLLIVLIASCTKQLDVPDPDEMQNITLLSRPSNNDEDLRIALSGGRYIPKGMTKEQETFAHLPTKHFANENITLGLGFINHGEEVRILNVFEPIPVFFSVHIEREDGTPIILPGGGKISFLEDSLDYITLHGIDSHYFDLNLGEILPEGLEAGTYTVSVEYHNQYGEDCFKGTLKSNFIILEVVEKTSKEILFEETYKKYIDDPMYCEKDEDCICMTGSGLPFVGCGNFLRSGPGGSGQCARCGCVNSICLQKERFGLFLSENNTLIISEKDIISYNKTNHEIRLTEKGAEKFSELAEYQKQFVVRFDGEDIYEGVFWTPISSRAVPSQIVIQTFGSSQNIFIIEFRRIISTYPVSTFDNVDPRNNPNIFNYFEEIWKLVE